ncbi:hypothetical protein [Fibrisoma limi]|uniref:hypothetical protein n=1 Tax=Fibrisoma limi TaxID=663275 RepID=UPI0005879820|nr:hypothetical protein [Fibrisoma limi]
MNTRKASFNISESKEESILTDWLTQVVLFHRLFQQLSQFSSIKTNAGQCSTQTIQHMHETAKREFKDMLEDVQEVDASLDKHWLKLKIHTSRLEQLNQCLQVRLQLVNQSSN